MQTGGWLSLAFTCHFVSASRIMRCTSALMSGWIHVFWAPEGIFFFNWMKYSIFSTLPFAFPALWPPGHRGTQAVVMCTGSGMRELRNALQHKLINLLNTLWDFGGFFAIYFFFPIVAPLQGPQHMLYRQQLCCNAQRLDTGRRETEKVKSFYSLWNLCLSEEPEVLNTLRKVSFQIGPLKTAWGKLIQPCMENFLKKISVAFDEAKFDNVYS